ncbi:ATP-binding cassette domain-containing protein [Aestuariirhabdus sp. Z084]|uniref:ATP-binding cassette domain-containing protein n=1 Tax=Aestuariirhabdus haliotis TaxID=2918751 RepID=UPI00201B3875|nr:ATP-binding cassette domain-containing protein [Aestuariirhabdus haliotis]MCL6414745.1 ATP-binding cassette domain-containing protein [Aestuariirhabdus haliotis]MCL6418677.1 ATP-binding cassette domain-containing protein [Aestuariirhabdus haliotis]
MPLLRFDGVSAAYGDTPLLDAVDFSIYRGERACLIGRNGAGKSTFLRLVEGALAPDSGSVWRRPGLVISQLPQELPDADDKLVFDVIAAGLPDVGSLLAEYHHLIMEVAEDPGKMSRLERVQEELEARDGWEFNQRIERIIQQLELPADKPMGTLSGGWRRRVILAQALVSNPDLLLLDEPTNHLDILMIKWLEEQLLDFQGAILFITHDRTFLQNLATRIIELDRGHTTEWKGDYAGFQVHKAHQLEVEERHNEEFDKKLAQEETWIRQGIKARRTRNEGRVRALEAMRRERAQRRERQGDAKFTLDRAERSGKLVAELNKVSVGFDNKAVIRDLSLTIVRGDKVGLIGANGCGKSTLLKLLLGQLKPDQGEVELGTKLEVAYFDQLRAQLDLDKSVVDNVAGGRESITINGRDRHIISYLGDFLFSGRRARTPVKALSGGERNRLLLAKLFSKPANLLVLDEPTNDLDVESLELLEALLVDFPGTVLLVSHDRAFLDSVVSSSVVFEGQGVIREYVGGFSDWIHQGGKLESLLPEAVTVESATQTSVSAPVVEPKTTGAAPQKPKVKLSYKLQRELEQLPEEIELLETELEQLQNESADGNFYQQERDLVERKLARLTELETALEQKIDRWAELEAMVSGEAG